MVNLMQLKDIFEEHNLIYNAVISRDPLKLPRKWLCIWKIQRPLSVN
jgi:hypothetical protein